jgi:predicted nucleic acid-binding protein
VGVLLLAKHRGLIDKMHPLLDDLTAQGFHLSDRVYC